MRKLIATAAAVAALTFGAAPAAYADQWPITTVPPIDQTGPNAFHRVCEPICAWTEYTWAEYVAMGNGAPAWVLANLKAQADHLAHLAAVAHARHLHRG